MSEQMPNVGDVMVSSWGYDQTNVDFYEVVRVSKASVWMQPMSQKVVEYVGPMAEEVVPNEAVFEQRNRDWENGGFKMVEVKPIMARWNENGYARVGYGQAASVWNGKPKYQSHYA